MLTPGELCTVPKAREAGLLKPLYFPVQDTSARTTCISCFPCQIATRIFLRLSTPSRCVPLSPLSPACSPPSGCFFARDYSQAGGPVRCARLSIYRRAGALTIWAPRFRRCCATRTASEATASTAATTTRNSNSSTFFTTGPQTAFKYLARIFLISNPARSTLRARQRSANSSVRKTS